jgi:hypothetical protein
MSSGSVPADEYGSAGRDVATGVVRSAGRGRAGHVSPRPRRRRLHHLHAGRTHGGTVRAHGSRPPRRRRLGAAPDAEIAAAARDYFAYCGTYELRGGEVVHRVELSLLPNWIGAEQVQLVMLDDR